VKTINKIIASTFAIGLLAASFGGNAIAADYPKKTITFVVPFGAGGGTDRWGRIMSSAAFDVWGQGWRVRNVPGASGIKGWKWMLDRPADGHTLIQASPTPILALAREEKPIIDSAKDIKVCALVGFFRPNLIVHNTPKYSNFKEFIAYAKKNPKKVTVGGSGSNLLGMATIFKQLGVQVTYVSYNGSGKAVADFLGKHVQAMATADEILIGIAPKHGKVLFTSSNKAHPKGYEKAVGGKVLQPKDIGLKDSFEALRYIGAHPDTPDAICQIISDNLKATLKFKSVAKLLKKIKIIPVFVPMKEAQKEYQIMVRNTRAATKLLQQSK
jgi:tripartite-type tricarboxylate transporter receptor subunit TctC